MFKNSMAGITVLILMLGGIFPMPLHAGQAIIIDGTTPVQILADPGNSAAAKLLQEFMVQAVPAAITHIGLETPSAGGIQIHLGNTARAKALGLPPLGPGEFAIVFPDPATIVIVGGSANGTLHGVSEFLERFAGVRWLFPGPLGRHVVRQDSLTIPMAEIRQKPAFISRFFSNPFPAQESKNPEYQGWLGFNRLYNTINFHHNLFRLISPLKYGQTHPEFFPLINGKPVTEKTSHLEWNPQLNAPGLTDAAIRHICEFFRKNPGTTSYSLGMNDCKRFADAKGNGINSMGYPNFSDHYYGWTNKVAAGVLKQYPDKYFGMLAYESVTDPPSFQLNRHCVPYICVDRMTWYDPQCAENDKKRTRNWNQHAATLGWYDYVYGDKMYIIPRVYNHLLAETVRFAAANGVQAYYAENYNGPFPTEGPKTYLLAKLLWNPEINVDAVLDDWYRCAVGQAAAPYLKQYFDFWENYWREKAIHTEWFEADKNWVYLSFEDHEYAKYLTTEDLNECRKLLDAVVAKAETAPEKARAELFMKTFQAVRARAEYALVFYAPPVPGNWRTLLRHDFNRMSEAEKTSKAKFPGNWNFWQRVPGRAEARWDRQSGYLNSGALRLDLANAEGVPVLFDQGFKVTPGKISMVKCKVKAQQTDNRAQVYIRLRWRGKNNQPEHTFNLVKKLPLEQRDGKWHELIFCFTTPPGDDFRPSLQLGVQRARRGTVWFDDFEFSEWSKTR